MSNGRFRRYYWEIRDLLHEYERVLDTGHHDYGLCDEYEVEYAGIFRASIVFKDGSRLIVRFALRVDGGDGGIEEYDYAYQYLDARGERVFRYDDAPHHPQITTYPHHLHKGPEPRGSQRERVYAVDVDVVNFATVFGKIVERFGK